MTHSSLTAVLLALLALFLPSSDSLWGQQTVTLRNGDRLTGLLERIDSDSWVFSYGGQSVTIPAARIVGFSNGDPIGVRLDDGTIAAVTLGIANSASSASLSTATRPSSSRADQPPSPSR